MALHWRRRRRHSGRATAIRAGRKRRRSGALPPDHAAHASATGADFLVCALPVRAAGFVGQPWGGPSGCGGLPAHLLRSNVPEVFEPPATFTPAKFLLRAPPHSSSPHARSTPAWNGAKANHKRGHDGRRRRHESPARGRPTRRRRRWRARHTAAHTRPRSRVHHVRADDEPPR